MELIFKSVENDKLANIMMDDAMNAKLIKTPINVLARRADWMKFPSFPKFRSFLTVLTNRGQLNIYYLECNVWVDKCNVSKLWYEQSKGMWEPIPEGTNPVELIRYLKERTHRLHITDFAWMETKGEYNLLFTATKGGTLVAWEVHLDPKNGNLELKLLKGLDTDRSMITSLEVVQTESEKCLLVYSTIDGQIFAVPVSNSDGLEFFEPVAIWCEKDRIIVPPGSMKAISVSDYTTLAVAKGSHLIVFLLTSEVEVISYANVNSGEITVSGFHFLTSTDLLFSTYSGGIYLAKISFGENVNLQLDLTPVYGPSKTENQGIMGIAFSPSKGLIALATTIRVHFNHLVLRELSTMIFCAWPENTELLRGKKVCSGPLTKIYDLLEVTRIGFHKKVENKSALLQALIDTDQIDSMEITEMKKNLWLIQGLNHSPLLDEEDEEKQTYEALGKEYYNLVTAHHILMRASKLLDSEKLTPDQQVSLWLMKEWLVNFDSNLDEDNFQNTQRLTSSVLTRLNSLDNASVEVCCICGSNSKQPFQTTVTSRIASWKCKEEHEIPRCALSLLQCTKIPYYECASCNIIALTSVVEGENLYNCIYCDRLLQKMGNVMDPSEID